MDTGASCNIISENTLKKLNFDFKNITKSSAIVRTYD